MKHGFTLLVIIITIALTASIGAIFAVKSLDSVKTQKTRNPGITIEYYISGTFTQEADSVDIRNLENKVKKYNATVTVMESFPMQFQISPLTANDCRQVAEILSSLGYISYFGECIPRPTGSIVNP